MLSGKSYATTPASSGLEAIEIIRAGKQRFDLIFLDLNMPGTAGIEVLKVLRIYRPMTRVLILSGHVTPEARAEFELLGQYYFMQKPYRLAELGRTVRCLLDTRTIGAQAEPPSGRRPRAPGRVVPFVSVVNLNIKTLYLEG